MPLKVAPELELEANDSEMAGSDSESDPVLESFMQQLFAPIFGDGHLTPGSGQLPGLDAVAR